MALPPAFVPPAGTCCAVLQALHLPSTSPHLPQPSFVNVVLCCAALRAVQAGVNQFLQVVLEGAAPRMSINDILRARAIMAAAGESLRTGKPAAVEAAAAVAGEGLIGAATGSWAGKVGWRGRGTCCVWARCLVGRGQGGSLAAASVPLGVEYPALLHVTLRCPVLLWCQDVPGRLVWDGTSKCVPCSACAFHLPQPE